MTRISGHIGKGLVAGSLLAALLAVPAPPAMAAAEHCSDVVLVLDESGSVATNETTVRSAVAAFLEGLAGNEISAAVVEFGQAAIRVFDYQEITAASNSALFLPYIYGTSGGDVYDSPSQTGPWTNWDDALDEVSLLNGEFPPAPLVLFITDGDPTAYNRDHDGEDGGITLASGTETLARAVAEADEVKGQGSHIVTIGVGSALTSPASVSRLQAVSGPDIFDGSGTLDLAATDVVLVPVFSDLPAILESIAYAMCADPSISIVKSADSAAVFAGSEVTYTFEVTNTGNVPLTDVTVSDPALPGCSAVVGDLAVGATTSYSCTVVLWAPLTNIATATGVDPLGTVVEDDGSVAVSLIAPGTGTPGYWRNHTDGWPILGSTVLVGDWNHDWVCASGESCLELTESEALAAITTPPGGDTTRILSRALITAWLNVSAGNDPSCIADTIDAAVEWLLLHPIGSGVGGGSEAWVEAAPLAQQLDDYNNGLLCGDHRDSLDSDAGDASSTDAGVTDPGSDDQKPGNGNGHGKGGRDR